MSYTAIPLTFAEVRQAIIDKTPVYASDDNGDGFDLSSKFECIYVENEQGAYIHILKEPVLITSFGGVIQRALQVTDEETLDKLYNVGLFGYDLKATYPDDVQAHREGKKVWTWVPTGPVYILVKDY